MSPSAPAFCKGLRSSVPTSLRLQEEMKLQGIGSILGFSEEKQSSSEKRGSLRRTLSADMSSKKWLAQTASSEDKGRQGKGEVEPPSQCEVWTSIMSQNAAGSSNLAAQAPYVHPLVRQSSSSLSEKSLEICTESLGSETGSDGFSSSSSSCDDQDYFFPSDGSEDEAEAEQEKEGVVRNARRELGAVNYNCSVSRRSPPRSFPPPLPSISRRDGLCLHMRPHRKDGRLVLTAVPVTPHNYLHAEREGGRLRLTFINVLTKPNNYQEEEEDDDEEEEVISKEEESSELEFKEETDHNQENEDEERLEEAAYVDRGIMTGVKLDHKEAASRMMKVHRSVEMMTKFMGVSIKNPDPWSSKKLGKEDEPAAWPLSRSLPASAPSNVYECRWRTGPARQLDHPSPSPNKLPLPKKPVLLKAQDILHARRCKEPRRPSLLVWEPRCIATS